MKARVDRDLCASCAVCVDICPEVFELDEEDIAIVKLETVPSDEETSCQEAADGCPSEAIVIED
jgi:ferredoxin